MELLPRAVQAGLRPLDFWQLTLGEIQEILLYHLKQQKQQLTAQATLLYNAASMIVTGFHDPKRTPKFAKAFPGLQPEPAAGPQDWRVMKARITAYRERKEVAEKGGIEW